MTLQAVKDSMIEAYEAYRELKREVASIKY